MEKRTHIAIVSVPVFSHQKQISEFCKRILQIHPNFQITFIIPVLYSLTNASKSLISSSFSSLNIKTIVLPAINLPEDTIPTLKLPLAMSHSVPFIHEALESIASTSKLTAIIADYFAYQVLPFVNNRNVLCYFYFPTSASVLSLCLHSSTLHQTIPCEYRHMDQPIQIPGCVPIQGRDLPTSLQDRSSESYNHFLLRSKALRLADGILVNSFMELEPSALKAITQEVNPSIYMIGPVIQNHTENVHNNNLQLDYFSWLNDQSPNSVLFVSFGSGGTISQILMNELALGLEQSDQKFLWVVREPNDLPSGNYYRGNSGQDPLTFLPEGFLERTKDQGFVIPNWAPQVEILSHKAIGAPQVVNGLPIISWPLFAEQKMIATILIDDLKVAIRPKDENESGIVGKCEIENVVKSVMIGDEGMEIRQRMKVLQDAAANVMKIYGSSTSKLVELVEKWKILGSSDENLS